MKRIAALLTALLLLAGCGGEDTGTVSSSPNPSSEASSSAPDDEGVSVDVTIKGGKVTPQGDRVDVKVGQEVTLRVTSDAGEEIHVHSDPEHTWQVKPGETLEESFTLERPGQVAVEAHHLDATIVQLVVRD